jgi:hypothetical protein
MESIKDEHENALKVKKSNAILQESLELKCTLLQRLNKKSGVNYWILPNKII